MNNYVLVTYFTINIKFIFVQKVSEGNFFVNIFFNVLTMSKWHALYIIHS